MNKKLLSLETYGILALVFVVVVLVLAAYVVQFSGKSISLDPAIWGQLGDYVGGILNPIVAFAALVVLSITLAVQRKELAATLDVLRNQQYEATFFQLLEIHQKMVDGFMYGTKIKPSARGRYAIEKLILFDTPPAGLEAEWGDRNNVVFKGYITTVKIMLRHFDSNAQLTKKKDFDLLFSNLLDAYENEMLRRYCEKDDELKALVELYLK